MKNRIIEKLKTITHGDSPYHKEGAIWNHIVMVLEEVNKRYPDHPLLPIIAEYHDFGKFYYEDKKGKRYFTGHSVVSANMFQLFDNRELSIEDKLKVFKVILFHHQNFLPKNIKWFENMTQEELDLLKKFRECDSAGRITEKPIPEFVMPEAGNPRYNKSSNVVIEDGCLIIPIGPPGVGKTTFSEALNVPKYGLDDLRRDLFIADNPDDTYTKDKAFLYVKKTYGNNVDNLYRKKVKDLYKKHGVVYADNINGSLKKRRLLKEIINPKKTIAIWWFSSDWSLLTTRNNNRSSDARLPEEALLFSATHIMLPLQHEFDEIYIL